MTDHSVDYKLIPRNSTVNGYPGSSVDWNLFDWKGGQKYDNTHWRKGTPDVYPSPKPYVDDFLIEAGNEYLHVPYNWADDLTIYRVRPSDSMLAGQTYRGRKVKGVKAVEKAGGWYWRVEYERATQEGMAR